MKWTEGVGGAVAQLVLLAVVVRLGGWRPDFVTVAFGFASAAVVGLEAWSSRDGERHPAGGSGRWLAIASGMTLLAVFALGLVGHLREVGDAGIVLPLLGGLVLLIGGGLRTVAIRTLGASFTSTLSVPDGRGLCTGGIYAWLRHPSELGLLLVALGASLMLGSTAGLCLTVGVLVPISVLRIRAEDAALRAAFPESHTAYAGRVWALRPVRPG